MPSPAGFVVKNELNISSLTSAGMPVPLSRILISTRSPRFLVLAARIGSYLPRALQGDCKALLFGSGTVIGKIKAFLDERIDSDRPTLT